MMRYMPLMFLVFLYNDPSGLALYWTMSYGADHRENETHENEPGPPASPVVASALTPASKKKK